MESQKHSKSISTTSGANKEISKIQLMMRIFILNTIPIIAISPILRQYSIHRMTCYNACDTMWGRQSKVKYLNQGHPVQKYIFRNQLLETGFACGEIVYNRALAISISDVCHIKVPMAGWYTTSNCFDHFYRVTEKRMHGNEGKDESVVVLQSGNNHDGDTYYLVD